MMTPKELASATARQWLAGNRRIVDTETTGFGENAEIVEIAIINSHGVVLLNSLVQPVKEIPEEATAVHGITNQMVSDAPTWFELHHRVMGLLLPEGFIAYNSEYDARLITQTAYAARWFHPLSALDQFRKDVNQSHDCVMHLYAEYYGEWDDRRDDYKWQRLTAAAEQQGVKVDGQAHRALADCLMTLGVIKAMAEGGRHE